MDALLADTKLSSPEMGRKGWPPILDRKLDGILQEIPNAILTTKTNRRLYTVQMNMM